MSSIKKTFEELSNKELYQLLKLRFDVFVWEQESFYDEYDYIDYEALHFFRTNEKGLITVYLRVYMQDKMTASLGRIVTHPDYRKKGLAGELIKEGIEYVREHLPAQKIKIGAQEHLERYYEGFGFVRSSDTYDDGGIPHIKMTLTL